jgi:hypothetical protein
MKNPNCDNNKCAKPYGEIRVLPSGRDSNLLLCKSCYYHEIKWRKQRNEELGDSCKFKLPTWEELKIYDQGE